MGVAVVRRAVGGPAGVADAGRATAAAGSRRAPSRGWRACRPACPTRCAPSCDQRDPGRVVAAVLQPPQALDDDVLGLLVARRTPRFRTWRGVYRRPGLPRARAPRAGTGTMPRHARRRPHGTVSRRRTSSSTAPPGPRWRAPPSSRSRADEVDRLRGLGDELDLDEVAAGLPPALPAAQPVRRGSAGALHRAQEEFLAPAAAAAHAVRDRARRLGRGRQVDHRPRAAADARPLARAPARRAGHHRRLPATPTPSSSAAASCTARASRSPTTARRCCGSSSTSSPARTRSRRRSYSHLVYDVLPDEPVVVKRPGHRDHRGPQRAPAGAGPRRRPHRAGGQRLLRLLRLRRRRDGRHPALVRRAVPAAARDRVPRPGVVLPPLRRALAEDEAVAEAEPDLGHDQRPQPRRRTSRPPGRRATLVLRKDRDHSVR